MATRRSCAWAFLALIVLADVTHSAAIIDQTTSVREAIEPQQLSSSGSSGGGRSLFEQLQQLLVGVGNSTNSTNSDAPDVQTMSHFDTYTSMEWRLQIIIFIFMIIVHKDMFLDNLAAGSLSMDKCANKGIAAEGFYALDLQWSTAEPMPDLSFKTLFHIVPFAGDSYSNKVRNFNVVPADLDGYADARKQKTRYGYMLDKEVENVREGTSLMPGDLLVRMNCNTLTREESTLSPRKLLEERLHSASHAFGIRRSFVLTVLRPKSDVKFCPPSAQIMSDGRCCAGSITDQGRTCGGAIVDKVDKASFIEIGTLASVAFLHKMHVKGIKAQERKASVQDLERGSDSENNERLRGEGEGSIEDEDRSKEGNNKNHNEEDDSDSEHRSSLHTLSKTDRAIGSYFRFWGSLPMMIAKYAVAAVLAYVATHLALSRDEGVRTWTDKYYKWLLIGIVVIALVLFSLVGLWNRRLGKKATGGLKAQNYHTVTLFMWVFCAMVPGFIFLKGRSMSNNSDQKSQAMQGVISIWMELFLILLFTGDAIFALLRRYTGWQLPVIIDGGSQDIVLGTSGLFGAIFSMVEAGRSAHANGAACSIGQLQRAVGQIKQGNNSAAVPVCESADATVGPSKLAEQTVADGTSCTVICSSRLSKPVTCYDYGLPAGQWTIIQENRTEHFCCHAIQCEPSQTFCPGLCNSIDTGCRNSPADCGGTTLD